MALTQSKSLILDEDSNLKDILAIIAEEENVLFAYPSEILDSKEKLQEKYYYKDIEDLLDQVFSESSLDYYQQSDTRVLLRRKSETGTNSRIVESVVYDSRTGQALPLASIYLSDYSQGVFSDENGRFELEVNEIDPPDVIISHIAYKTLRFSVDELSQLSSVLIDEEAYMMESAVIEYVLPPYMHDDDGSIVAYQDIISNTSFSSALLGNDLLRYLQLTSGITAFNDNNVDLRIRGSNADNTRIVLDEMPLYELSHYYGIFSAINSAYIDQLQLYKNDQPIEYEGLGGGMLLLESNSDNVHSNSLEVNLLTASLNLDIPLTSNTDFKLSTRSSYRNVNDELLLDLNREDTQEFVETNGDIKRLISNQPDFKFYDFNFGIHHTMDQSFVSVNAFRSYDKLLNNYDLEISNLNQSFEKQLYNNEEIWKNTAASLIYKYELDKKNALNLSSYYAKYNYDSVLESELRDNIGNDRISNTNNNSIMDYGFKAFIENNLSKRSFLYGLEFKSNEVMHQLIAEDERKLIDYSDQLKYWALFGEYKFELGRWAVKLASRSAIFKRNKDLKVFNSPQLRLSYELDESNGIKLSVSRTNQILREIEYETRLGQNLSFYQLAVKKEVPVLKTMNYMIGYEHKGNIWSFDLEFYHKKIKGNILLSTPSPGFIPNQGKPGSDMYRIFVGDRKVFGMDMTLMYRKRNFSSWIAYTLSKSQDSYPQVFRAEYFSSQDDRRHQLKWINSLDLGSWSFNMNFIYASGKPYLAFENIDMVMERENLDPKEVLKRLPDYFRMDLGVNYNFEISDKPATMGVSVYNLTNRKNLKYIQYSYRLDSQVSGLPKNIIFGTESELLGRSLNINFNMSF